MVTFKRIGEALAPIVDPEIRISISDLGLIYGVTIDHGPENLPAAHLPDGQGQAGPPAGRAGSGATVRVQMSLTTPACPYGPMLLSQVHGAVSKLEGVTEVDIDLVFNPPWDPRTMASEECKDLLGIF